MFANEIPDEARKRMIWFFLKTNLVIFGLFLLFNGIINQLVFITMIALVLFIIGGILVYRDIRTDHYQMLKLLTKMPEVPFLQVGDEWQSLNKHLMSK